MFSLEALSVFKTHQPQTFLTWMSALCIFSYTSDVYLLIISKQKCRNFLNVPRNTMKSFFFKHAEDVVIFYL